jgi:predicted GTPase
LTKGRNLAAAETFEAQAVKKVLILGAAGRDFHNFNVVLRDDPAYLVAVAREARWSAAA